MGLDNPVADRTGQDHSATHPLVVAPIGNTCSVLSRTLSSGKENLVIESDSATRSFAYYCEHPKSERQYYREKRDCFATLTTTHPNVYCWVLAKSSALVRRRLLPGTERGDERLHSRTQGLIAPVQLGAISHCCTEIATHPTGAHTVGEGFMPSRSAGGDQPRPYEYVMTGQ